MDGFGHVVCHPNELVVHRVDGLAVSIVPKGSVSIGFNATRCMSCTTLRKPKGNTAGASLSRISGELGPHLASCIITLMSESRARRRSSWDGRSSQEEPDDSHHRECCYSALARYVRGRWM